MKIKKQKASALLTIVSLGLALIVLAIFGTDTVYITLSRHKLQKVTENVAMEYASFFGQDEEGNIKSDDDLRKARQALKCTYEKVYDTKNSGITNFKLSDSVCGNPVTNTPDPVYNENTKMGFETKIARKDDTDAGKKYNGKVRVSATAEVMPAFLRFIGIRNIKLYAKASAQSQTIEYRDAKIDTKSSNDTFGMAEFVPKHTTSLMGRATGTNCDIHNVCYDCNKETLCPIYHPITHKINGKDEKDFTISVNLQDNEKIKEKIKDFNNNRTTEAYKFKDILDIFNIPIWFSYRVDIYRASHRGNVPNYHGVEITYGDEEKIPPLNEANDAFKPNFSPTDGSPMPVEKNVPYFIFSGEKTPPGAPQPGILWNDLGKYAADGKGNRIVYESGSVGPNTAPFGATVIMKDNVAFSLKGTKDFDNTDIEIKNGITKKADRIRVYRAIGVSEEAKNNIALPGESWGLNIWSNNLGGYTCKVDCSSLCLAAPSKADEMKCAVCTGVSKPLCDEFMDLYKLEDDEDIAEATYKYFATLKILNSVSRISNIEFNNN